MADERPKITGVLETSLYVADIGRSQEFYGRIFGFRPLFHDHRMCAMEVPGAHVLLLFKIGATDQPAPAADGLIPPHHGDESASVLRHHEGRIGGLGGASGPGGGYGGSPTSLAARFDKPVFPRS